MEYLYFAKYEFIAISVHYLLFIIYLNIDRIL